MPRTVKLALLFALIIVALLAAASAASAAAKLTADYRFEGNFKSKIGNVPNLIASGGGGSFGTETIGGSNNGVWNFPDSVGVELHKAGRAMGDKGKTYTFVMLMNLDDVADDSYDKLVDFDNLDADEGWYIYDHSLYPYDVNNFEYEKQEVQAGKWEQIALTRNARGIVTGYVGDKRIDSARDKHKQVVLGDDKILHFLMDDSNPGEASPGAIARLRIWRSALSGKTIKHLGR